MVGDYNSLRVKSFLILKIDGVSMRASNTVHPLEVTHTMPHPFNPVITSPDTIRFQAIKKQCKYFSSWTRTGARHRRSAVTPLFTHLLFTNRLLRRGNKNPRNGRSCSLQQWDAWRRLTIVFTPPSRGRYPLCFTGGMALRYHENIFLYGMVLPVFAPHILKNENLGAKAGENAQLVKRTMAMYKKMLNCRQSQGR